MHHIIGLIVAVLVGEAIMLRKVHALANANRRIISSLKNPIYLLTPSFFRSFSSHNGDAGVEKQDETSSTPTSGLLKNFISNIIEEDLAKGKNGGRIITRFPPEPNGYLHLGHAKSVNFNFGIAAAYGGVTNMRFDDTNPAKEDMEYVHSILDDVRWLVTGNTKSNSPPWNGAIRHASDYFQVLYDAAEFLIQQGLAYVDDLTAGIKIIPSFLSLGFIV